MINSNDPLVTVIIPVFNGADFIGDAIYSVLEGSYSNVEILVIDDCSLDNSVSIISSISVLDSRVRLIRLPFNSGVSEARNEGLRASNGEFVAFLDCDDFWSPEKLRHQIDFMLERNVRFSFTSYFLAEMNGQVVGSVAARSEVDFKAMLLSNWIGCSTVVISRDTLQLFSFDNSTRREDYWLWLQILKTGLVAYGLSDFLVYYRVHGQQSSKRKFKMARENFRLYLNVHGGNYLFAIKSFLFYSYFGLSKAVRLRFSRWFISLRLF